jgi:hypothetical protein
MLVWVPVMSAEAARRALWGDPNALYARAAASDTSPLRLLLQKQCLGTAAHVLHTVSVGGSVGQLDFLAVSRENVLL